MPKIDFPVLQQLIVSGCTHVVPVEVFQFLEIKPGGGLTDCIHAEPFDHVVQGHDLFIAMAPTETGQVVAHCLRQIPQLAIGLRAGSPVTLGQFCAIRAVYQRDVGHLGDCPSESLENEGLSCGIGQMIDATNNVSDTHVVIVNDDGQHISRRAV